MSDINKWKLISHSEGQWTYIMFVPFGVVVKDIYGAASSICFVPLYLDDDPELEQKKWESMIIDNGD